jgi:hypothetical protein
MTRLAAFVMAGRWQAVAVVLGFAVLGLALPPVTLLSGAALGLIGLRLGAYSGGSVLLWSAVAITLASAALAGQAWFGVAYSLIQWLPVLLIALLLRRTVSLAFTLQTALLIGLASVVAMNYLMPGTHALWTALLDEVVRPALVNAEIPAAAIDSVLARAAEVMNGGFVAALLLSLVLTLLIARWWQALLYNPGGFRDEFTGLQLGYPAAGLALTLAGGAVLTQTSLIIELAMVAAVVFFLQGMAVTHAVIAASGNPTLWLLGVYGLLLVALPQMMAGLSLMGAVDSFVDFRARLSGKRGS